MLDLTALTCNRVAVFHIPPDQPDRTPGVPTRTQGLVHLDASATAMVQMRLTKALGKNSHGIEVTISNTDPAAFVQVACHALDADDAKFLADADALAVLMAKAQNNFSLGASKLVVVGGTLGAQKRRFLAVVKAELQEALGQRSNTVEHLKEIFMTESQRLYKIGFLHRTVGKASHPGGVYSAGDHAVHLFDHLMTKTETKAAAHYFYNGFLGCVTATSARALTKQFYEQTQNFIHSTDLDANDRFDLVDSLRADLRSNHATISVDSFATAHLTKALARDYKAFMEEKKFPAIAITKDNEYVTSKLKRKRKITFSTGIVITTPPDMLNGVLVTANEDGTSTVRISGIEKSRE